MKIFYGKKSFEIKVRETGFLRKGFGLMFRTRETENLIFNFSRDIRTPITSLFVFFRFLVLWLDENDEVLEWKVVRPFEISLNSEKPFRRFVEIPFNEVNKEILDFFVEEEKFK